jgi:hypothetical protein
MERIAEEFDAVEIDPEVFEAMKADVARMETEGDKLSLSDLASIFLRADAVLGDRFGSGEDPRSVEHMRVLARAILDRKAA